MIYILAKEVYFTSFYFFSLYRHFLSILPGVIKFGCVNSERGFESLILQYIWAKIPRGLTNPYPREHYDLGLTPPPLRYLEDWRKYEISKRVTPSCVTSFRMKTDHTPCCTNGVKFMGLRQGYADISAT